MSRVSLKGILAVIVLVVAVLVAAMPVAADCNIRPLNAGAITPERAAECAVPRGPVLDVNLGGSTAYGSELVTATLASFNLASPGTFNPFGVGGGPIGALEAGCALVGGDSATLYCFDLNAINNFYSYDTATGVMTDIGDATPSGADSMTGLAWDATTGTMYASGSVCGISSSLYTVDIATGATTLVGTDANGTCAIDVMVDNAGVMYSHDIVNDAIYSVDKTNGAMTLIGSTGFDANYAQGAACDPNDGNCYLFAFDSAIFNSELRLINTATGSTTPLGALGTNITSLSEVEADIAGGAGPGLTLNITGTCPGPVTLTTSGGSGGGGILVGSGPGSDILPGGPCAGLASGLSNPTPVAGQTLDLNLNINAGAGACGRFVQILQVSGCVFSNVGQIPVP